MRPETATYDYHARRYDPSVGRFTGVDAIRQSISPYSYTANNPINFVDTNGLGRVPFFVRTGMHYSYGRGRDSDLYSRNIATWLKRAENQHVYNADVIFSSTENRFTETMVVEIRRIISKGDPSRKFDFSDQLFWFIDDHTKTTALIGLSDRLKEFRILQGDFADKVVLFDFTEKGGGPNFQAIHTIVTKMGIKPTVYSARVVDQGANIKMNFRGDAPPQSLFLNDTLPPTSSRVIARRSRPKLPTVSQVRAKSRSPIRKSSDPLSPTPTNHSEPTPTNHPELTLTTYPNLELSETLIPPDELTEFLTKSFNESPL